MSAFDQVSPPPEGVVYPVRAELLRLRHQIDMWNYWQAARGTDTLPADSHIDPTLLPPAALPFVILYAVGERPDKIQIRLEGTRIVEFQGQSRRGGEVGQVSGTGDHLARLNWAATNGKPYYVETKIDHDRYYYRVYSALVLPFGQDGRVTRLLGVNGFD